MNVKLFVLIFLLAISGNAIAQYDIGGYHYTCPVGTNWNDPRCTRQPIGEGANMETLPNPPSRQWKLTWGAIAMSRGGGGDVGTSVGKYSKREATREAVSKCEALGSAKCDLQLAYKHQCAVIAWASENGQAVGGAAITQSGPSIEVASKLALSACGAKSGSGECEIVYSDCTKPVLQD